MPLETASWPPSAAVDVQQWVLDSFTELSGLRRSLFAALHGQPMPPGGALEAIPEKMAIVATELATNALSHGAPPTCIRLRRTARTFILDVADEDPGTVPHRAGPRPPGEGGLGLHIVAELVGDAGWYADETTKHVWVEFPIPPATP
ncbi:MAG: ATP-binding protein [Actinoplanes sp.]